jgi:hypothetical protein
MGKSKHKSQKFRFYMSASLSSDALSLCITVTMHISLSRHSVSVTVWYKILHDFSVLHIEHYIELDRIITVRSNIFQLYFRL